MAEAPLASISTMRRTASLKQLDQDLPCRRFWQLRLKNLVGHGFHVRVDLEENASRLADLFASHECLPRDSHIMTSLRFVYNGWLLDPDVPLWKYGIVNGSMISTRICPYAWSGTDGASEHEDVPEAQEKEKVAEWVKVPIRITTPFAEVEGTLEFPEQHWSMCRLSPKMLSSVYWLSDSLGVNGAFVPGREIYWQLRLGGLQSFPCHQTQHISDVWRRLQTVAARIEIDGSDESLPLCRTPLIDLDESIALGDVDAAEAHDLHLSVSLLTTAERAIEDVTQRYRETDKSEATGEVCCICLEPMLQGEMCRRLACLHRMHAGCAMTFLPAKPTCPVCRSSVGPGPNPPAASSLPALPLTPQRSPANGSPGSGHSRSSRTQRSRSSARPPLPSTPTLPSLPRQGNLGASPGASPTLSPHGHHGHHDSRRDNQARSPVPRLVKVLSQGLKTIRQRRSWSAPRVGQVTPQ